MLDDQQQVKVLMKQMKAALPIPATLTSKLVRSLRAQGRSFRKREILIHRILYSGDEGGILCAITPPGAAKEVVVVSLTHLRVSPKHPLGAEIRVYQQARTAKLARQRR